MDRQVALYLSLRYVSRVFVYPSVPQGGREPLKTFFIFLSIVRLPHWFPTPVGHHWY